MTFKAMSSINLVLVFCIILNYFTPCYTKYSRPKYVAISLCIHTSSLPQNSLPPADEVWGKVMFLHLSVSHSVHRGGVCLWVGGCTPPGHTHPDTYTPIDTHTHGYTYTHEHTHSWTDTLPLRSGRDGH